MDLPDASKKGGETMEFRNIEAERARLGLSKADLATAIGVSYSTMKNYLRGETDIPCSKVIELANLFNCTTDYLLGLDTTQQAANQ